MKLAEKKKSKKCFKIVSTATLAVFLLFGNLKILFAEKCKFKKEESGWKIYVDEKPFQLKGVGCGYAERNGVDYFKLAKELGANCVRTWGINQGTKEYFKRAEENDLYVDTGLWVYWCYRTSGGKKFSYINNKEGVRKLKEKLLSYVRENRKNRSLIIWNLGNEAIKFAKEEKEKVAVCRFINDVAGEIKKIDPDHPVIYTASGAKEFYYIKKYLNNIDGVGINVYGSILIVDEEWRKYDFDIPYFITELGPKGPWDCKKDMFGLSIDYPDYEKAFFYQVLLEEYEKVKSRCLGVFVFYLGDTTQESLTWWNLTIGNYKRESFYVVKKFFRNQSPSNYPPYFTKLELDKRICKKGEKITANVSSWDRDKDNLYYDLKISTAKENVLVHDVNREINVDFKVKSKSKIIFNAPGIKGVYRVHIFVYDGKGNVATRAVSFKVEE